MGKVQQAGVYDGWRTVLGGAGACVCSYIRFVLPCAAFLPHPRHTQQCLAVSPSPSIII